MFSAQEFLQHVLGLALTTLHVDRLQDGYNILEQEFGIIRTPPSHGVFTAMWFSRRVQEFKNLQLPPQPHSCLRYKILVLLKELRCQLSVSSDPVCPYVQRVKPITVDLPPANDCFVLGWGLLQVGTLPPFSAVRSIPPEGSRVGVVMSCRHRPLIGGRADFVRPPSALAWLFKLVTNFCHGGFAQGTLGLLLEPVGQANKVKVGVLAWASLACFRDGIQTDDAAFDLGVAVRCGPGGYLLQSMLKHPSLDICSVSTTRFHMPAESTESRFVEME